jgi:hypothetical protein
MTEIFEIFQSKLEYLTLALGALQDPDDPNTLDPEVKGLLIPLRQLAAKQVSGMAWLMRLIRDYSTSFIQLVNASPLSDAGEGIPDALVSMINHAKRAISYWTHAKGEMDRFSGEVKSTAQKISAVLENSEQIRSIEPLNRCWFSTRILDSSGATFLTEENSRAVNDLIHAAEEASTIFQGVYQYFLDSMDHFKKVTLI